MLAANQAQTTGRVLFGITIHFELNSAILHLIKRTSGSFSEGLRRR
jgi:hypothetical protein